MAGSGETGGQQGETRSQLQERLMGYAAGSFAISGLAIGDRLGLYTAMVQEGQPITAEQLAKKKGLHERWVREWLLHQATLKLVSTDADARTFWMTPEQADVLANEDGPSASPGFMAGGLAGVPYICSKVDALCGAFSTGLGLKYDEYGPRVANSVRRDLRVWPRFHLIEAMATLPEIDAKLRAGARVADVGCGEGECLMLLAKHYPQSTFEGYDTSHVALKTARQAVCDAGLANVTFHNPSGEDRGEEEDGGGQEQGKGQGDGGKGLLPSEPVLDFVLTMDALHDMARPDLVMASVRKAIKPDGHWLIGDFQCGSPSHNVHENAAAPLLYGFSLHLCMSSAMSEPGGLGLGTCGFSDEVARKLLQGAGFTALRRLSQDPFGAHPLMSFWLAEP